MKYLLFVAICTWTILICSCNNISVTDKVVYYPIDTIYYKNHPGLYPQVNIKNVDSLFNDLDKKRKFLTKIQIDNLEKLLNNPTLHSNVDCGTIWKDGVFVFYNSNNELVRYIVVSLDCYDLLVYAGNQREGFINLNKEGQKLLFSLIE